ncbi:MAG TPA: hypothetical protein VFA43_08305 [Gemmatimonadaceae bacterium]|nr:hypothetical protein [Gemmatimonadaceae bacterium]
MRDQTPRPGWVVTLLVIAGVALILWITSVYVLHKNARMRPANAVVKDRPATRP